jgi:hypothetical protein
LCTPVRDMLADRPAEAARGRGGAGGLWGGGRYADLEPPRLAAEARRLEELRLRAVEDRLEAELAVGGHAEAVAELEALSLEHPLRERP